MHLKFFFQCSFASTLPGRCSLAAQILQALGPWHVLLCGWGGGKREQVQCQGGLRQHDMLNAGIHCSGLAHDLQLHGPLPDLGPLPGR